MGWALGRGKRMKGRRMLAIRLSFRSSCKGIRMKRRIGMLMRGKRKIMISKCKEISKETCTPNSNNPKAKIPITKPKKNPQTNKWARWTTPNASKT